MTSGDLAPRNVVNPVSSAEVGCTERTSSSKVIPIFSIFVRRRRLRLRAANNVKAPTEKEYRPKLAKPSRELKLAETTDVSSSSIKVISKEIAAKNSTKQIIPRVRYEIRINWSVTVESTSIVRQPT